MFQKPAFGANTSNFGSFNSGTAAASPFGSFKPTTPATGFGAPAFGAGASTQPATGGGLFGAQNTTGGLFGNNAASTSTSGFGASTSGFGFGAPTSTGGLFGANNTSGGGLFGNTQAQPAFGAKPAGFGFGAAPAPATTGGTLFGSAPASNTGLFGQQNNTMGGGGLFSNTGSAFGQPQTATGTAQVKYNPVVGTDVVVKSGQSQTVNIKHHCITCMKEYENKSLEELRLEDYVAGNKGQTQPAGFGASPFGQQQENKPMFPAQSAFGQPATTNTSSVFGATLSSAPAFGQTSSFSFGQNQQANTSTTGLFATNKPAFGATAAPSTGLFGATTTQAQPATSSFGFGANTTQNQQQAGGLFGAKPAGAFGAGAFGASNNTTAPFGGGGLFGAKTSAPAFGTTTPAFGTMSGGFGTNTSTSGGLFGGGSTFGKPATTQPAFGFNAQPTLGAGLGAGVANNSFQAKPATGAFGTLGTTNMFQQPTNNTTFKTGLEGGLGGGLFGNTSTLGGSTLGMGNLNTNTNALANNSLSGASAAGNVHEQILTLAARPYGDSPLFKDLLPDSSTTTEDVLKPTNPAAVKAVLDKCQYRVTSPTARLTVRPRPAAGDKKSLFDGLEESDASLEDKLCLKPSRKRLVLRTSHKGEQSHADGDRSVEESQQTEGAPNQREDQPPPNADSVERARRNVVFDQNADISSERHGSWLSSSKLPWNEKEKSIDNEPTPRIYPNLDKDLQAQVSERRASWLTTKPLHHKPIVSNPDSAENSVRELGVKTARDRSHDKENVDTLSVSEEESLPPPRPAAPHPAGVRLTRPGYYTIPSLDEMIDYMRPDGSCVVPHLTIGRKNYGNVFYDCEIDVTGMDLDALVHFMNKEVIVYPDEAQKPPLGVGLNRRAIVTLDRVWPRDKTARTPITDPDRLIKMEYEAKLRRVCDKHDTKFIEYRALTGSWVFRVEHFSKYGLTDSDEEDEHVPEVVRRQLTAPPAVAPPTSKTGNTPTANNSGVGLGGLGLGGGLGGLGGGLGGLGANSLMGEDNLFAMQQTSLNLLNGAGKAFEMDTTEGNGESPSLYHLDNKAYGVKSPTSELARLEHRHSHNVQLMKASLYNETEMDEDASVSTGDQLVPVSVCTRPTSVEHAPIVHDESMGDLPVVHDIELPLRPLIVRPHTIVLKYHRKVPPFKQTIAGRLDAQYIADMSVCRARHSRIGFGPANTLVFATSYDAVNDLPKKAELSELGSYVRGRTDNDWSEPVAVRMALTHVEKDDEAQEILRQQLQILLDHSTSTPGEAGCPRLVLAQESSERLAVLNEFVACARDDNTPKFGVSRAYCAQVWKLCAALWEDDLRNDGIASSEPIAKAQRHRRLLSWLSSATALDTDKELATPRPGESEDETDGHSAQIFTLLLGGRVLEACKLAREKGDLNMATLIAQASGDETFRGLLRRQLSTWQQCGTTEHISATRLAILRLLAANATGRDLAQADWLRAFHATARYLCAHVPSLEQVMRKYDSFFADDGDDAAGDDVDLTVVGADDMSMRLPLPPYVGEYDAAVFNDGKRRRVLDLRYELLRARAFNSRPKLSPASYTPDPMDYSLCFLLGVWFGNPTVESIVGCAELLEASGDWHLAVLVLAYHPDTGARGHLIRGVLSRHAPSSADTPELQQRVQLIHALGVPETWLLLAQAHRAKYENRVSLEVQHLSAARQWGAAHRLLVDELLPEAVLADNLSSLYPLLERMHEAASRHEVGGWESGGLAVYLYMKVCEELRNVTNVSALEALRPRIAAACRALGALQPKHGAGAMARCELGARLAALALAPPAPPAPAAALLRALRLPPDVAHHKITALLAESSNAPVATSPPIHSVAAS